MHFSLINWHMLILLFSLIFYNYFNLINLNYQIQPKMSSSLKANKEKLEEMKRKRLQRQKNQQGTTQSEMSQNLRSQIKSEKREWSLQKSEDVHLTGALTQTYDMEIQCVLQTRSLDSKAHKQIEQEKQVDLLQPKQIKKRRDQNRDFQTTQVQELNQQELESLVKSKHFTDFFNKSSKFLQKVLDHGDGDMLQLLLSEGLKSKQRDEHDILSHAITFTDQNYTTNRVITDLDWSPQISELLLASYSQNDEGSIKDHVGVALLWNPALKNRPEFYCFCQSAITSAKFFPFSNNTVIGGCYNGQLLLWDIRVKSMPQQRSGISADAHKYPVNSLNIIGTQLANKIASFSNDGMMCEWDIKQFSKPIRVNKISAARPTRVTKPVGLAPSVLNRSSRLQQISTSSVLDRAREEAHEINVTCCQFPRGDTNNYYIGSLNGAMYKNALHNKATQKILMYDEHNGPISSLSVNYSPQYEFLNGLVLTSSYDWTAKLWNPNNTKQSVKTFQNSQDYIYDVCWNPNNPTVFATANNEGYVDVYDLTKDSQLPLTHKKVNNYAQNKMTWNTQGSALITGDSSGSVSMFVLADRYRKPDTSKLQDLSSILTSINEQN